MRQLLRTSKRQKPSPDQNHPKKAERAILLGLPRLYMMRRVRELSFLEMVA